MKKAPQRSASARQRRGSGAAAAAGFANCADDFITDLRGSPVPRAFSGACPFRPRRRQKRNGRSIPGRAGVITGDDRERTSRCEELVPGDALGEATLARARAGDEDAFRELTDPHRRELQLHCYRILGTMQDAEDLVQETLLAAWRSLDAFEGRASVRTWLYQIATNRCLNALRGRSRRPREVPAMAQPLEPIWLEPYPDVLLDDIPDRNSGPSTRYEARESCELAFIVALQRLPPRQRA